MVTKVAKDFLTFWCAARGSNIVPAHTDIHLEGLEGISARVLCSAWDDQGRLVIRYVGTDLVEAFRTDTTGTDLMSLSHPDELELSRLTLNLVGDQPCGLMSKITLRGENLTPREFECIFLPVEREGRYSHIIELVNPLDFDYRPEDTPGSLQALRYSDRAFIDIGAGTPLAEGPLAPYGTTSLKDLMQG